MTEQLPLPLDLDAASPTRGAASPRSLDDDEHRVHDVADLDDRPADPPTEPACAVCAGLEHVTERCPHGEPLALDLEPVAPADHTNPRTTRSAAEGRQPVSLEHPEGGPDHHRNDTEPSHWRVCEGGIGVRAGAIRNRHWWMCPSCQWVMLVTNSELEPTVPQHNRPR